MLHTEVIIKNSLEKNNYSVKDSMLKITGLDTFRSEDLLALLQKETQRNESLLMGF